MVQVEVFDPPMCCSTGVCGPSVDPALATFAADLGWLGEQGVPVERHNLSQEPGAFAENDLVRDLLAERGEEALPAVLVRGVLRSSGRYPSRAELEAWATGRATGGLDEPTAELVAIGAAVGANCEPCFKHHYDRARRLGVTPAAMADAVRLAHAVKDTPARAMLELAAKLLGTETNVLRGDTPIAASEPAAAGGSAETSGGCCGGPAATAEAEEPAAPTSGCCGGGAADTEVTLVGVTAGGGAPSGCCG